MAITKFWSVIRRIPSLFLMVLVSAFLSLGGLPVFSRLVVHYLQRQVAKQNPTHLAPNNVELSKSVPTALAGSCDECFSLCFPKGTRVAIRRTGLKFLTKAIEFLRPGDRVLAVTFPILGKRLVPMVIKEATAHNTTKWQSVEITTTKGLSLRVTDNHWFVIDRKNRVLSARDLLPGQKILVNISGVLSWDSVANIKKGTGSGPVYNIELRDEPHNYLVSQDGQGFVLAHNVPKT